MHNMNWNQVISDLLAAGYTLDEIAKECGMARKSSVSSLHKSGGDALYRNGVRLVQMHRKVMRKMSRKAKEQA